jgi:hypothetical protein
MSLPDPPDGWTVWNAADGGRVILAYRPDVFDTEAFPPPCLPTIYLSPGPPRRRPGMRASDADDWTATLFLEPDIEVRVEERDSREAGVDAAFDLARAFSRGEVDYRAAYQLPREAYLDRLDALTGRD